MTTGSCCHGSGNFVHRLTMDLTYAPQKLDILLAGQTDPGGACPCSGIVFAGDLFWTDHAQILLSYCR